MISSMNFRNRIHMIKIWQLTFMLLTGLVMYSCYPGGPEDIADYQTVFTDYDQNFDFTAKKTFFMPDTINFVINSTSNAINLLFDNEQGILNKVVSNLETRGYTQVDTTATEAPDMLVEVDVVASSYSSINWVPSYTGYGYYPQSWGWYGSGYYYPSYYPVGYSYDAGSVIINLSDPSQIDPASNGIVVVWFAALDGLLSGNEEISQNLISNGIDQAFNQSPYLKSDQ